MPKEANKPISAGFMALPWLKTICPVAKSSPARRMCWLCLAVCCNVAVSPCQVTRSCISTVSAPCGITAPVMIFTHSPGPIFCAKGLPAKAVPISFSCLCASSKRNAMPSIAELSCAGTLHGEMIFSANTRLKLSRIGKVSVSVTGDKNCWINCRACVTDIALGS